MGGSILFPAVLPRAPRGIPGAGTKMETEIPAPRGNFETEIPAPGADFFTQIVNKTTY